MGIKNRLRGTQNTWASKNAEQQQINDNYRHSELIPATKYIGRNRDRDRLESNQFERYDPMDTHYSNSSLKLSQRNSQSMETSKFGEVSNPETTKKEVVQEKLLNLEYSQDTTNRQTDQPKPTIMPDLKSNMYYKQTEKLSKKDLKRDKKDKYKKDKKKSKKQQKEKFFERTVTPIKKSVPPVTRQQFRKMMIPRIEERESETLHKINNKMVYDQKRINTQIENVQGPRLSSFIQENMKKNICQKGGQNILQKRNFADFRKVQENQKSSAPKQQVTEIMDKVNKKYHLNNRAMVENSKEKPQIPENKMKEKIMQISKQIRTNSEQQKDDQKLFKKIVEQKLHKNKIQEVLKNQKVWLNSPQIEKNGPIIPNSQSIMDKMEQNKKQKLDGQITSSFVEQAKRLTDDISNSPVQYEKRSEIDEIQQSQNLYQLEKSQEKQQTFKILPKSVELPQQTDKKDLPKNVEQPKVKPLQEEKPEEKPKQECKPKQAEKPKQIDNPEQAEKLKQTETQKEEQKKNEESPQIQEKNEVEKEPEIQRPTEMMENKVQSPQVKILNNLVEKTIQKSLNNMHIKFDEINNFKQPKSQPISGEKIASFETGKQLDQNNVILQPEIQQNHSNQANPSSDPIADIFEDNPTGLTQKFQQIFSDFGQELQNIKQFVTKQEKLPMDQIQTFNKNIKQTQHQIDDIIQFMENRNQLRQKMQERQEQRQVEDKQAIMDVLELQMQASCLY